MSGNICRIRIEKDSELANSGKVDNFEYQDDVPLEDRIADQHKKCKLLCLLLVRVQEP